jgi:hypothetical protein
MPVQVENPEGLSPEELRKRHVVREPWLWRLWRWLGLMR